MEGFLPPWLIKVHADDIKVTRVIAVQQSIGHKAWPQGLEAVAGGGFKVDVQKGKSHRAVDLVQGILKKTLDKVAHRQCTALSDVLPHLIKGSGELSRLIVTVDPRVKPDMTFGAIVGEALKGITYLQSAFGPLADEREARRARSLPHPAFDHIADYGWGNLEDLPGKHQMDGQRGTRLDVGNIALKGRNKPLSFLGRETIRLPVGAVDEVIDKLGRPRGGSDRA